jgi:hypothetical protein
MRVRGQIPTVPPTLNFDLAAAQSMPFFDLCDRVWDAVVKARWASNPSKDITNAAEAEFANRLDEPWRISYAIHEMEYDVLSGGFDNFFFNHGDALSEAVVNGLGIIGAQEHQTIFRVAAANQENEDILSKLDSRYYEACRQVDPRELLAEYIRSNFDRYSSPPENAGA